MILNTSSTIIRGMNYILFKLVQSEIPQHIQQALHACSDVIWAVSDVSDISQIPPEGGLYYDGSGLSFVWPQRNVLPISFDFDDWVHKMSKSNAPVPDLIKAVGKNTQFVIDATCGSGRDALTMVMKGIKVRSYEKNPIIYLLLIDAIFNLTTEFKELWELIYGDFSDSPDSVEVLYYDPMFDRSGKTALPRKEMELFHSLFTQTTKNEEEKHLAYFKKYVKRLVVKRADKSEPLELPLTAQWRGKTVRYDLHQLK